MLVRVWQFSQCDLSLDDDGVILADLLTLEASKYIPCLLDWKSFTRSAAQSCMGSGSTAVNHEGDTSRSARAAVDVSCRHNGH